MSGTVRQLPVDPGPAAWNRLLVRPEPATSLRGKASADWLIIGAGFAGLAAARRLTQLCPDDRITILEATRVADGPAGRNSGFMIDLPHDLASENYGGALAADQAQIGDNRRAIEFAASMARDFGMCSEAFSLSGKINAAATSKGDAHNQDFARHLSALGEPFEWRDAQAMQLLTGTRYYTSGLYTPGTAMIQPAMFVRAAARGLRELGVQIHENSPVIDLTRDNAWVAKTPSGQITAPRVILAVNGHLQSFGFMAGRLMHVFTYASMTRALTAQDCTALGGAPMWGLTPADPMGTTVRRLSGAGGDRILIRNRFTYDPAMVVDDARLEDVGRDHDRAFAARFPMLDDVGFEYRWGGRLCLSRNNVQVIGRLDDGLWSACCQNGLGTAKGTLAGLLAAECANDISSPSLARALAAAPPRKLPPSPIVRLGATARLRWDEWRAGREM